MTDLMEILKGASFRSETVARHFPTSKRGKIMLCALHDHAEHLVRVCKHLREFLATLQVADLTVNAKIDQVILPYVDDTIARAMKERQNGLGGTYS